MTLYWRNGARRFPIISFAYCRKAAAAAAASGEKNLDRRPLPESGPLHNGILLQNLLPGVRPVQGPGRAPGLAAQRADSQLQPP